MASPCAKPLEVASLPKVVNTSAEILNSWKEIARYLARGVRTVQRWESAFGLPVRRPHGRRKSSVFAVRSEVDAWLERHPGVELQQRVSYSMPEKTQLLLHSQRLRSRVHHSELELGESITKLVRTLSGMLARSPQE